MRQRATETGRATEAEQQSDRGRATETAACALTVEPRDPTRPAGVATLRPPASLYPPGLTRQFTTRKPPVA